jgi:pimeloyl-ACP methyl ester carboxylesterase
MATTGTGTQESTNVRAVMGAKLAPTRALFRILEPPAPGLAGRLAARLWCTAPTPRTWPNAAPAGERFLVPVPGRPRSTIVAETWGEGPTTYLLHGWGGRRTQLSSLVAPLLAAGQRVVALDAPGHGDSGPTRLGGRLTTGAEIGEALVAVAAVAGPAHAIVGHSAGALAAAVAVHDGLPARRLVFIAPMVNPMAYLDPYAHALGLGPRSRRQTLHRIEQIAGRQLDLFDLLTVAGRIGNPPPLLVIHDRRDREVSYQLGSQIAANWPGARLLTTDRLGHRRILADPAVMQATVDFVTTGETAEPTAAKAAGSTPGS